MFPKRYILCIIAFAGYCLISMIQSNMSIAILAMVQTNDSQLINEYAKTHNERFDWNTKTQGYILSSIWYSVTLIQIPAGYVSLKFDLKILLGTSTFILGLTDLFVPLFAHWGFLPLIFLRFLQGINSGAYTPFIYAVWTKWIPKQDRPILTTVAFSGLYFGTFMSMIAAGVIGRYWSWRWIFYLSGTSMIIWTLCWFYFVTSSPSEHPSITQEELIYIESNLDPCKTQNYSIPWKRILSSSSTWALAIGLFSTFSFGFFALSGFPLFLRYGLAFTIDQTGVLGGTSAILIFLIMCLTSVVLNKLQTIYSTTVTSKVIFNSGMVIATIFLIILIFLPLDSRLLILVSLFIITVIPMMSVTPLMINQLHVGGRYAGYLVGFTNFVGSTPGFILPVITGHVVQDNHSKTQWNILFTILIFISLFGITFYSIFGTGELQFGDDEIEERQYILENSTSTRSNTNRIDQHVNQDNEIRSSE